MVVRWLRDAREQGAELGVELLAATTNPVRVRHADAEITDTLPALFMPSSGGAPGTVARLIAPPEVYAPNRVLVIYVGEREITIRCRTLVEQGPAFDCFEFTSHD
jgi:hypothetical protein